MNIEALVKEHLGPLYRFVYRIVKDESEAEDIVQKVFVKVWKNLAKFDREQNFKTWIFTIARNTAVDYLRKNKNISFSELDARADTETSFSENIRDLEPLPDEIFIKKESDRELSQKLEEALSKIRPDFREIILLRYVENLEFSQIAEIVGKPLNTVRSQHLRGLKALRNILLNLK